MKKVKISFAFIMAFAMLFGMISPGSADGLLVVREAVVLQDTLYYLTNHDGVIWKMEYPNAPPEQVLNIREYDDILSHTGIHPSMVLTADEECLYLLDERYQTLWEIQDGTLVEKVKLDFSDLGAYTDPQDENSYYISFFGNVTIVDDYLYMCIEDYPDYENEYLYRFSLKDGSREKIEVIPDNKCKYTRPYKDGQILVETWSQVTYIYDPILNTATPFIDYPIRYSGLTYNPKTDRLYYFDLDTFREYRKGAEDEIIFGVSGEPGYGVGYTAMWQDLILAHYGGHLYTFETVNNYIYE